MTDNLSRRQFLGVLGAGLLSPYPDFPAWELAPPFRIRTITAGIELTRASDVAGIDTALGFLTRARQVYAGEGYEIQTTRITTQPLPAYLPDWPATSTLEALRTLDRRIVAGGAVLSVGPVLVRDERAPAFAAWAADLVRATTNLNFSAFIASPESGVHYQAAHSAAEAIAAIARSSPGGEGNFRFAATAFCPPGTPFFPAGYHAGERGFSIGLESPPLLKAAFTGVGSLPEARSRLRTRMNEALAPIEAMAKRISAETDWRYIGIDVSPAPLVDASIGEAIETLTGEPFGGPATLAACALITQVLQELAVQRCGYSGLMLPVLEDPILAQRAREGRYGLAELLLYSSVCGTGLDVVPIPGDTAVPDLEATLLGVAALATRYRKALSARLFPVPGKQAGDEVRFDHPYLVPAMVMRLG